MKVFDPQIILFVADTERAARFYADTAPVKIEMSLDGFGRRPRLRPRHRRKNPIQFVERQP